MVFLWWKCLVGDRQCVKQNTQLTSERHDEEEPQAYPSRIKELHRTSPQSNQSWPNGRKKTDTFCTILTSQFEKAQ